MEILDRILRDNRALYPDPGALTRRRWLAGTVSATAALPLQLRGECVTASTAAQIVRSVDAVLQQEMENFRIPAVSYAVMGCKSIPIARALGVLRAGGASPVTPSTLFQAASISKTIAAVTALLLVQNGKLTLDEPVDVRLKSWRLPPGQQSPSAPVTLRRLLGMTAGINVHGFAGYQVNEAQPTPVQILQGARPANSPALRVINKPGSQQLYSGGGYQIAEMLMRDVTGQDYAELAASLVFRPVKMTNSHFGHPLTDALAVAAAEGHDNAGVPLTGRWHNYPELAAAGLWTTPTDLGLLCNALSQSWLTDSGFLRRDLVKEMMTRVDRVGYGLGGAVSVTGDTIAFSKGGDNAGYHCTLIFLPQSGDGVVIMTNGDQGSKVFGRVIQAVASGMRWPRFSAASG